MAFTEDLSIFLADFGVSCTAGAVTALGILDMPGQVISDGMVLTTDYTLTAKASDFGSLIRNDAITVDAVAYTVREAMLLDDGRFVQIALQKTLAVPLRSTHAANWKHSIQWCWLVSLALKATLKT